MNTNFSSAAVSLTAPSSWGRDSPADPNKLREANDYTRAVAIGPAISRAFEAEKQAPIYGVYVHESARSFAPESSYLLAYTLFRWYDRANKTDIDEASKLKDKILQWLDWLEKNKATNLFTAIDKLETYRSLVREYFG
jgi:hypothetical protein